MGVLTLILTQMGGIAVLVSLCFVHKKPRKLLKRFIHAIDLVDGNGTGVDIIARVEAIDSRLEAIEERLEQGDEDFVKLRLAILER